MSGFHQGRPARNKGLRYPLDPPTVEEIIAVMRAAGDGPEGIRLRGVIVALWRAGLRISEALALSESDLDRERGALLVRRGKGGKRREVGMDSWAWAALERRDIDRQSRTLTVRRTVSSCQLVDLGKTERSRRQVPLSLRAISALDSIPPRLDTGLIFPAPEGGLLNIDNLRRRAWTPAIEASGVRTPARLYDLRSTFASDALSVGVTVFELARVMGTSVPMIERHYGALVDGAGAGIAARLDRLGQDRATESEAGR